MNDDQTHKSTDEQLSDIERRGKTRVTFTPDERRAKARKKAKNRSKRKASQRARKGARR